MSEREKLPQRRRAISIDFAHVTEWVGDLPGKAIPYRATLGYYDDGRLGEIFVANAKAAATMLDISVRDAAIALSIGLQHGVDPQALVSSFLHDSAGRPEGVLGQLLRKLHDEGLLKIHAFDGLRGSER